MKPGKVYIGGAGPGDPGLVTIRLLEAVRDADVILHDRHLDRSILLEAREGAEIIDVGKSGDPASRGKFGQDEINRLLVERAYRGKTVLRLKGGDPFVFGRGAEECEVLSRAGIPFEIIPGVSSAVAVPAYAGIPLTHRDNASAFAVATGHLKGELDISRLEVPRADTLVYLMGVQSLPRLAEKIVSSGWAPGTPAAVIQNGTRSGQRTIVGTLETIAREAAAESARSPAVLVVGNVVRLRDKLSWFERKPLFGKRVVVTRALEKQGMLSSALRAAGADVVECPAIAIRPIEEGIGAISSPESLSSFTDIIFTSETAVRIFFKRLLAIGGDARNLGGKKVTAIGPATAAGLKGFGISADCVPHEFTAEGILDELDGDLSGRRFLLPRAKGARRLLPDEIEQRGGEVEEWLLYETVPTKINSRELESADAIIFMSSSAVSNLCRASNVDRKIQAVCIGTVTARRTEEEGFRTIHSAREATVDSLVEKVIEVLEVE